MLPSKESVTNTTDPSKPLTGTATISFDQKGQCVLRVDAPLYGSGPCSITEFDEKAHTITIVSDGPSARITAKGTYSDAGYEGYYTVEYPNFPDLPQYGTFSFGYDKTWKPVTLRDVLTYDSFTKEGKMFYVLADRNLVTVFDSSWNYAGVRIFLDQQQNPVIRIEDHKDGSLYVNAKTGERLMEWHTDGKGGVFSKTSGSVTTYFDRFMSPNGWYSVDSGGTRVYGLEQGESIELFDSSFKPLNVRSGKTSSGKLYWTKKYDNGLTEYFDGSMKPLNWYSTTIDGRLYYGHLSGKKMKVYDANMRPLQKKPGFWASFGRGLAAGLAAYGQALQTQAAYASQASTYSPSTTYNTSSQQIGSFGYSTTTGSNGTSYSSTTQRIGNFDYTTTTGSNGYFASVTNQHIGNFGYVSGTSTSGYISGTQQQIGTFNYSNYTTPQGQWNGTSQQIGNFTYHTFTAPDGSLHTGTTQRIGDFIYTNIQ